MPVMDGFEATRRIRDMEDSAALFSDARIPIVALTANTLAGDEQSCLDAGMNGFCSKPINAAYADGSVIDPLTDPLINNARNDRV